MNQFDKDVKDMLQGHPLIWVRFQYIYWETRLWGKYGMITKNIIIHITDMIHHYVFRHFPPHIKVGNRIWYISCACDTLAESEWWACNHKDWYCRKFNDWEELKEQAKGG